MRFKNVNQQEQTLESLLKSMHVPKKEMHWLRMSKDIVINDSQASLRDLTTKGDDIHLPDFYTTSSYVKSNHHATVRYEDDYIAVLLKPHHQKTHPNNDESDTLMNDAVTTLHSNYVEPVHRLDYDTKGLVIVAKNAYVKKMLDVMIQNQEIIREYTAYVSNVDGLKIGDINLPIGRARHKNHQEVSRRGKKAVTHVVNIKNNKVTVQLSTGRTHQIRVHLSHVGAPIIGDDIYGKQSNQPLQLFASRVSFTHPITKEQITVTM